MHSITPRSGVRVAFAVSNILLATHTLAAPIITNLGVMPGGTWSEAWTVNGDGSVVAGWGSSFGGMWRAFRWTRAEGMHDLGSPPGVSIEIMARGISANGRTVVGTVANDTTGRRGFRWTAITGMQVLGTFPGESTSSWAYGVSTDGSMVAGVSNGIPAPHSYACRWNAGGFIQSLGTLPDHWNSIAYAMSADGSAVSGQSSYQGGPGRAFRWTTTGGMENLGVLGLGEHGSAAYGISADGNAVVGFASLATRALAFRWTPETGMQNLGLPPNGVDSYAWSVSGDGSVVVGKADGYGYGSGNAVMWTAELGMVDLNAYLPSVGVDLTGWELYDARAVSADGYSITGQGMFNGQVRAWLVSGLFGGPCIVDVDDGSGSGTRDGGVTIDDLLYFLQIFEVGSVASDVDDGSATGTPDRGVTIDDLLYFLQRFEAGC